MTPIRNLPNTEVDGVVIVCTDITDLKETEAALTKSYEEQHRLAASETAAKEASRLKSEFTANLSHEIRTPISKRTCASLWMEKDLMMLLDPQLV